MKLDYGIQISPFPIALSIGTLKKPSLRDILELTFDKFSCFEFFLNLTPNDYYTKLKKEEDKEYWNALTVEQKEKITLYDLIKENSDLQNIYSDILNFFFIETVVYHEGYFILLKQNVGSLENAQKSDICGVISQANFTNILDILRQICCIKDDSNSYDEAKVKNNLAKRLLEKMSKGQNKSKQEKRLDINATIPNIISALANKHPSLNYTNIWDLTLFQLLDSFRRVQTNSMFDISSTRVSVWGDEKNTFDPTMWYKNEYDKN